MLTALLDFARIKQALSPSDEPAARGAAADPARRRCPSGQTALLSLTGWAQVSVNALLTQFFGSTDPASLSTVENFRRVYDAYTIVQDLPADSLGAHRGDHQRARRRRRSAHCNPRCAPGTPKPTG